MPTILVEMTFPSSLKEEPVIYEMGHDFKVVPRIIEASFSSSQGWALLSLDGEEEEIERLFEHLRGKGVIIDRRQ